MLIKKLKAWILQIVMCRFYWALMLMQMPILIHEDVLVEMTYTKLYLFIMGCSITIFYFNRHNGT